ncbi:MAG TPA: hypothetical protein VGO56_08515 [Pyrinomonadaceae bacterium]|jgi:hypothetical protein|nr:hypothetical protein [Pyrinomonadaceae bacterium]
MHRKKQYSKFIALVLAAALLSACQVPDLSEFTKQSAEMTRGIRTGIKDTETVLKTASQRDDLFSVATRTELKKNIKEYQGGMKPTIEALDALDAYLEALNALAQANKKSEENSKAAVDAITNLVTAVSGLTFASSAVNVAKGLVTLGEQFRTTRDFKKRVNLAAEIVEGKYVEKVDSSGNVFRDEKGKPILVKACKGAAEDEITSASSKIKQTVARALDRAKLSDNQTRELQPLSPEEKREKLRAWGKFTPGEYAEIRTAEFVISSFGCGVIDLIKFNVKDLKGINLAVSRNMHVNAREKNRTVLGFYDALEATDRAVQHELETILNYKSLVVFIKELEATGGRPADIRNAKINLKRHAEDLFDRDGQLRNAVLQKLNQCGVANCGAMLVYLQFDLCADCEDAFILVVNRVTKNQFDRSNGYIEAVLDDRARALFEQNTKYIEELKRITPAHSVVVDELKSIDEKQNALDQLLDASVSALDTWATTHANLRVAVNTNKPLSVFQLASKVREIWSIINPEAKSAAAR